MAFHTEERRRWPRRPGETDGDLDARMFARYAEILAAMPDTEPILDQNDFEFWKRHLRTAATGATSVERSRPSPVARHSRHEGTTGSWGCDHHDIPCTSRHQHIERTLTDSRAARERQSG